MEERIGTVISRRRQEKGLSQRELATAVNVSNSTIARIETGESIIPSNDTLKSLAKILNFDYNYLLALCDQIDDEPEIRMIQRAAHKMTKEEKEDMIRLLQISFKEAFKNVGSDDGE